jgi:probable rRNA maturation factor
MPHGRSDNILPGQGFELSLANQQANHVVNEERLVAAAEIVLADAEFESATISLAVVDDETIHALNRQYLNHDWPTDVLSFVLDNSGGHLNGEVILSADTAAANAAEIGWAAADEQLLYVIHGMLHLIGYDDQTDADREQMRAAESRYLNSFGVECPVLPLPQGESTKINQTGGWGGNSAQ